MAPPSYRISAVPVRGGPLAVAEWGPDDASAPVMLAVHGVTANHLAWSPLAATLPQVRVIAPDLRGRGRSNRLGGPYGMRQHVEDLVAVLDGLAVPRVTLVGHSMGGFVSVAFAAAHPERLAGLLLVDGGIPFDLPAGMDVETLIAAVLGPAAARLSMTFASHEAYRDFWKVHPAFVGEWSPAVEAYVDYDLAPAPEARGQLRPSTLVEAMTEDSRDLYAGSIREALTKLPPRATLLTAARGLLNGPPVYSPEASARRRTELAGLTISEVPDVNHYTIVMSEPGARRVAAEALRVRAAG